MCYFIDPEIARLAQKDELMWKAIYSIGFVIVIRWFYRFLVWIDPRNKRGPVPLRERLSYNQRLNRIQLMKDKPWKEIET